MTMSQISAIEQEMLELINRARANPGGEYDLVVSDGASVTGATSDITNAMRFFGVDPFAYRDAMAGFDSAAPLAWNTALSSAAEGHSADLLAADAQSHQLPGGPNMRTRIEDAGYSNWSALGENVYSYAESAFEGHAAFMIDWGYDAEDYDGGQRRSDWQSRGDGMQDPAGHRNSIMSDRYTEIGIGILEDTSTSNRVGPYIVTQNFGNRRDDDAQLLGVVIDDADGDRFYDAGEGLGGVTVTVSQGGSVVGTTTTWAAGGYQIALAAGTYDVSFSGGTLAGRIDARITMGTQNTKLDAIASDASTDPTPGADIIAGTGAAEDIRALAGADWITPGGGNDTIDGGAGTDMVSFANLAETPGRSSAQFRMNIDLEAGRADNHDGSERVTLSNVERVSGTAFADRIRGDDGDNELRGLGAFDWFIATAGNDIINGGDGQDMLSFQDAVSSGATETYSIFAADGMPPAGGAVSGVVVDLTDASNNTGLAGTQTLISVERVTGSSFQDVFVGNGDENDFRGLGGYDWFVASAGGRERYFGGDGFDTVTYALADAGVSASLSNGVRVGGRETGYGSAGIAGRDLYFGIENFVGSNHDDTLHGSSERNQLSGLDGDDFLFGGGGIDYLKGGSGNDTLDGGAGSDFALFDGDAGDFTIARGTGADANQITVAGEAGTDLLIDVEYLRFDDVDITIWSL